MRLFIIDASNMGPELQGGLIGVVGSASPDPKEKKEWVDGWAIAADPHTPIGWLAAVTAEAACVPFLNLRKLGDNADLSVSGLPHNRRIDSGGAENGID
jgi:hypothetical protein